jgi:hypothetical protein
MTGRTTAKMRVAKPKAAKHFRINRAGMTLLARGILDFTIDSLTSRN